MNPFPVSDKKTCQKLNFVEIENMNKINEL